MSTILLRFEAIESRRFASYSCPKGTTGRVHALRLVRRFPPPIFRAASTTPRDNSQQRSGGLHSQSGVAERSVDNKRYIPTSIVEKEAESVAPRRRPSRKRIRNESWRIIYGSGTNIDLSTAVNLDVVNTSFSQDLLHNDASEDVLWQALREDEPHAVLDALIRLVCFNGEEYLSPFLQSLTPNVFSAILRCLDPAHFVGRYGKLEEELSKDIAERLSLPAYSDDGYPQFCIKFLSQIYGIVEARRRYHLLSLTDWKYLLKCARATGNARLAKRIWETILTQGDLAPDTECFNHYLSCACWSEKLNINQKHRLQIIARNMEPRAWTGTIPYTLAGHAVGNNLGIKARVSRLFSQMVDIGLTGNEETFCLMMTALAREGDTDGIASILKRVWGIDIEGLLTSSEVDLPPVKVYVQGSPFYPTGYLLHTLAHAYGINNSIPTALRLVDFVSRQYDIEIPVRVWEEILTWTFILSLPKKAPSQEAGGFLVGQLPPEAVSNLWNTMTSEPYNIQPTMFMYNRLITNLIRRECFGEAKVRMDDALKVHSDHVSELGRLICRHDADRELKDRVTEKHRRDLAYTHLRVRRSRLYIRRWVRLWLRYGSKSLRYDENFSPVDVPKFAAKWASFLPAVTTYEIASGTIELQTEVLEANQAIQDYIIRKRERASHDYAKSISRWGSTRLQSLGLLHTPD
jgi:hypothetical protein